MSTQPSKRPDPSTVVVKVAEAIVAVASAIIAVAGLIHYLM